MQNDLPTVECVVGNTDKTVPVDIARRCIGKNDWWYVRCITSSTDSRRIGAQPVRGSWYLNCSPRWCSALKHLPSQQVKVNYCYYWYQPMDFCDQLSHGNPRVSGGGQVDCDRTEKMSSRKISGKWASAGTVLSPLVRGWPTFWLRFSISSDTKSTVG